MTNNIVFDKHWFKENQRTLLSLLNSPIGGLVRRGLWIKDNLPVVKITPDSVHILLPDGKIRATVYSNKQYAKALHVNYKPIWEAFHWWDMKLANRLIPAWNLGFDTFTSQPDSSTGNDVYLDSANVTANYDTYNLYIGELDVNTTVGRVLIKFDYSSIDASATISSGTFTLTPTADYSSNTRTYTMYRVLRNWVKTQATWNEYSTGNAWGTAGCGNTTSDYNTTSHGSRSFTATETLNVGKDFTMVTAELTKFINGTYTNYGYLVRAATETNDAYEFADCENATSSYRPKVVVVYTAASTFVPKVTIM